MQIFILLSFFSRSISYVCGIKNVINSFTQFVCACLRCITNAQNCCQLYSRTTQLRRMHSNIWNVHELSLAVFGFQFNHKIAQFPLHAFENWSHATFNIHITPCLTETDRLILTIGFWFLRTIRTFQFYFSNTL